MFELSELVSFIDHYLVLVLESLRLVFGCLGAGFPPYVGFILMIDIVIVLYVIVLLVIVVRF